jgi:hypothetical protein
VRLTINKPSIPWSEVKASFFSDPEIVEAYKEMSFEYEIISEIIKTGNEQQSALKNAGRNSAPHFRGLPI